MDQMKIGIDARRLVNPYIAIGLYSYTYNLIAGLQKIDAMNDYTLFFHGFRRYYRDLIGHLPFNNNFHKKVVRIPSVFFERIMKTKSIPVDYLIGKVDVYHGTAFDLPSLHHGKSVVTFHDLMFMKHPEFLKPEWVDNLKRETGYSIRKAEIIISVSRCVKEEIVEVFKIPEKKIKVIYEGKSDRFKPVKDKDIIEQIKMKYGISGKYLLYIGNIEPKKNIARLINAFNDMERRGSKDYLLVIAGPKGWYYEYLLKEISDSDRKRVIFTGSVEDGDLPVLYSGAEVFVFPSLYEGFGLPPLEAMACGTPVIASNAASIPEVVGDAGILVDPFNQDELSHAIYSVLTDNKLRDVLSRKGIERSELFTWEKCAKETLEVYQSC